MLNPNMIAYTPTAGGTDLNPTNLNQAIREEWDSLWRDPLQQRKSILRGSGLVIETDFDGLAKNYLATGLAELSQVSKRNPDIVYKDPNNENRQIRFARYQGGEMYDVVVDKKVLQPGFIEARLREYQFALERLVDKVGVAAIGASRIIGSPFQADPITGKTAVEDGMIELGEQTVNYALITTLQANAQNAGATQAEANEGYLLISANEEAALKQEEKFISNLYNTPAPAGTRAKGFMPPAFNTMVWAGSKTGGKTITNPVLPEDAGKRTCYFMLPRSLVIAYNVNKMGIFPVPGKLNSISIVVDVSVAGLVIDGNRSQSFTTTI